MTTPKNDPKKEVKQETFAIGDRVKVIDSHPQDTALGATGVIIPRPRTGGVQFQDGHYWVKFDTPVRRGDTLMLSAEFKGAQLSRI